jgi:hypothetical protein
MSMMTCRLLAGLSGVFVFLVAGCGDGKPKLYKTAGQVLIGGKAAPKAFVVFHSLNGETPPGRASATTDDDGRFALTTMSAGDGAPAGNYAVVVTWPIPPKSPFDGGGPDRLRGRYGDPATTPLKATIAKQDENLLEPFQLDP